MNRLTLNLNLMGHRLGVVQSVSHATVISMRIFGIMPLSLRYGEDSASTDWNVVKSISPTIFTCEKWRLLMVQITVVHRAGSLKKYTWTSPCDTETSFSPPSFVMICLLLLPFPIRQLFFLLGLVSLPFLALRASTHQPTHNLRPTNHQPTPTDGYHNKQTAIKLFKISLRQTRNPTTTT